MSPRQSKYPSLLNQQLWFLHDLKSTVQFRCTNNYSMSVKVEDAVLSIEMIKGAFEWLPSIKGGEPMPLIYQGCQIGKDHKLNSLCEVHQ